MVQGGESRRKQGYRAGKLLSSLTVSVCGSGRVSREGSNSV